MSMFKEFAMPPLVLTVIAAVVTGALVATESVTTPIIEQQAAAAADAARAVVLPSADSFTQVTVDEMPEGGVDIYEANNGTGYVVTAQAKGYGGMLKVMVGIDSNGLISGTEVLENNETQGLGSKVSEHAFSISARIPLWRELKPSAVPPFLPMPSARQYRMLTRYTV